MRDSWEASPEREMLARQQFERLKEIERQERRRRQRDRSLKKSLKEQLRLMDRLQRLFKRKYM